MIALFTIRKGLVEALLLPYLNFNEKMIVLPALCTQIRLFIVSPKWQRHFFNCVYTDFLPCVSQINIHWNCTLNNLIRVMDWEVASNMICNKEMQLDLLTFDLRLAGLDDDMIWSVMKVRGGLNLLLDDCPCLLGEDYLLLLKK